MAFLPVETIVEGAASLHHHLSSDLSGVQEHPHLGAAGAAGDGDQVVQATIYRYHTNDPL